MNANPNHAPQPAQELTAEELSVYSIDKVEALRTRQLGMINGLRESATGLSQQYIDDYYAAVDNSVEEFLSEQGIDNTSPNYDEIRQLFRDASVGQADHNCIPPLEWENSPASIGTNPHETKSQRELFEEVVAARLENQPTPDPDTVLDDAELERMQEEAIEINGKYDNLQTSREEWASVSAKRQGKVLRKGKDHDKIRDDYQKKLREFGIISLADEIDDDDDDTTKNAKVIAYLFEEQRRLRELTTEKLKNTKTSKFIEWMNRGGTLKRLGKAGLVGLAASGAAAGISLVAGFGLVAGAAGGAAAGAVGAGRFIRGYAKGDRARGMQTAQESFIDENGENTVYLESSDGPDLEHKFDAAAAVYHEDFESDTNSEQKKRRKAVVRGMTTVALGVGVGAAVHFASDVLSTNAPEVADTDSNKSGGNPVDGKTPEPTPKWVDVDKDGIPDSIDSFIDTDDDGIADTIDIAPRNPDITDTIYGEDEITTGQLIDSISDAARTVDPGEGWYQTFQELGIPQNDWEDTLQYAGPKLQEQGWAYFDDANSEWRITKPGLLDEAAINTIAGSAKQAGFTLAA